MNRRETIKGMALTVAALPNLLSNSENEDLRYRSEFQSQLSIDVGSRIVGLQVFQDRLIVACEDGKIFDITDRNEY